MVFAESVCFRDREGCIHTVAVGEVILCAGVMQSPQILELSGIGSPELLRSHNIEPVVDLPQLGENLQDHVMVGVSFETNDIPTFDSFRDPQVAGAAFAEYQQNKTGPLAMATFSAAFLPCMDFLGEEGEKDLKELFERYLEGNDIDIKSPSQTQQHKLIRSIIKDPSQTSVQYLFFPAQLSPTQLPLPVSSEARTAHYITFFASLSHPFSRGSVHITSLDSTDPPSIDPHYFSHPLNVEIMARHLKHLSTIIATDPLASLLKPNGRHIPTDIDLSNLDAARKLTELGFSTCHPCGTCAMMPRELGGVVDQRLRVHGVGNVRVVDASVFPMVPRGNIQSSVYAVAERAADMIKGSWAEAQSRNEVQVGSVFDWCRVS